MKKIMQSLENVKGFTTETEKELQEIMGGSMQVFSKEARAIKRPGVLVCYGVPSAKDGPLMA